MNNSQEMATIIKNIAKNKKIAIGKMLSDCDLNKNTLSTMQSGGYLPRVETLSKIADYLDCSVDYLLGRTDASMETAETYSINNQAQTFQGNQTNVVQTAPKQRDSMKDEFMQAFDELPLADKIEVMSFTMQKVKKGA